MDLTINYLAVVLAAVAAFFVGFMWHGPVFGKIWMRLSNITPEQIQEAQKQSMAGTLLLAFLQQLVLAFVLAYFMAATGMTALVDALKLAALAWLGFIATSLLNGVLWEKRTPQLYLFNIAYHLVALLVMALIIALM